jgi:hypothetical protein
MKLFFSNAEANVRILKLSPLLFSALLLGCNASTQTLPDSGMPDDAESVQADVDATGAQPSSPQTDASRPASQEQLLQLRTDSQRLQEQNQMVLNRLQLLSSRPQSSEQDSSAGAAQPDTGAEQLDMAIGQLMQVLNSLDNTGTVGGEYAITTTYTRSGDWVLLRYHRGNGSTWLADGGDWRPLQEQRAPARGDYEVLVHRADQDRKGYVAVRIDRTNGNSWWLNDNRWQEYLRD